jgi:starch phosphorylase
LNALNDIYKAFKDKKKWAKKSILAAAGMAKFSSDRSIHDYAENIWGVNACPV